MSDRFGNQDFFTPQNSESAQLAPASFLVASPALHDSMFRSSVVFLLQNDEQGTFGAVLNRPAEGMVADCEKQIGLTFARESIVKGGPLGGPILAIHQKKTLAEVELSGGICLSVKSSALQELAEQKDSPYRIVLGIAGWQPGQLKSEIDRGFWYPMNVDPQHVFDDQHFMWHNFLREYGRQTLQKMVGLRNIPASPELN